MMSGCAGQSGEAVSYTHLDVYKRQDLLVQPISLRTTEEDFADYMRIRQT